MFPNGLNSMSIMQNLVSDLNVIVESSKLNKMILISLNMGKSSLVIVSVFVTLLIIPFANGENFEKATLQESAIIVYDQKFSDSIVTSIGYETTSNKEVLFSDGIVEKINNNSKIRSVVFTNSGECVMGVTVDEQCLMINFDYQKLKGDQGIKMIQTSSRNMSMELAKELSEELGIEVKFHSSFIHTVDDVNILLETSGAISGRGSVSATYIMEKQATDFLFVDLAARLIHNDIREGGGFYDVMKKLAKDDNSIISISMIRNEDSNLFMFKIANEKKPEIVNVSNIDILENLGVGEITRSKVFDGRNVPLNSIIQLIVIPNEQSKIDAIATHAITDLTTIDGILKKGWFFSNPAGDKIDAKFLFGQHKTIYQDELRLEIGPWDGESGMTFYSVEDIPQNEYESLDEFVKVDSNDEDQSQYVLLGIIIAVGIGAAIFYLKGYKPKH